MCYFSKYSVGSGYSDFLVCNPKPEQNNRFLLKQHLYPTHTCTWIHLWTFRSGGYGQAGQISRVAGQPYQQCHRVQSMHSRIASCLRVQRVQSKCLWRFLINHLPNIRKVASPRHKVDSILEMCQPFNSEVSKRYLCLFAPSTQPIHRCFSHLS